jgi:hypothetical protein
MPLPEFTDKERFFIQYVESPKMAAGSTSYMWAYVLGGTVLAVVAAYVGSIRLMGAAFVVVCGFRIYEERYQKSWMPVWRSIVNKYEAALGQAPDDAEEGEGES